MTSGPGAKTPERRGAPGGVILLADPGLPFELAHGMQHRLRWEVSVSADASRQMTVAGSGSQSMWGSLRAASPSS